MSNKEEVSILIPHYKCGTYSATKEAQAKNMKKFITPKKWNDDDQYQLRSIKKVILGHLWVLVYEF